MDSTLTVLFQILQKITILLIPLVTKQLLDFAAQKNDLENFSKFGFAFLGLSLLSILFLSLRYYFQSKLEAEVINDLKYAIGKKTFSIPYMDFLNKEPGYFVQRINRDTERLTGLIISDMSMFLINIVYACSIIFLMFDINFLISLILMLLFPLFLFVSKYFIPKIKKVNEMIMEQEEELNSHFNENINANYFIRVSNLDSHFNRKSELKLKEIYKTVLKKIRYEIRYDFFLVTGIMNLSHVLIYWLGGYLVFSDVMTFGSLTAISLYFSRLWSPIEFFMDFPKKIKEEEISLNRIRNLLDEPDTGDNIASSRSLSNPFEHITIRNLSFTHGEKKIFDNLSLKIKKGDKIGIIGDNGSGKTTLMNLLTKIYTTYQGDISYNNIAYGNINSHELRKKVIFIPQELYVFSDFNKDNGGKNSNRSGGEKKLLQITERLNQKGELYLFDEPLAYVDTEKKKEFLNFLESEFSEKTFLVISHDEDIFKLCNRIYKIRDGRLIELSLKD